MPPVILLVVGVAGLLGAGALVSAGVLTSVLAINAFLGISLSLVLNGVTQLVMKHPSAAGATVAHDMGSSTVSVRQPLAPWQVTYGRDRRGGVFTYIVASGNDNKYINLVITMAGHQLTALSTLYFDGVAIPVDANGDGTGAYAATDGSGAAFVHWKKKLGAPGEAAFPGLIAEVPSQWTVNHRQDGRASCYLRLKWDATLFPNGIPVISFDIKGRLVFDPRSGLTAYSENPALAVRDYLTNSVFGLAEDTASIDDNTFIAAANICDQQVVLRAGGSEAQYSVNGSFSVDAAPKDILQGLLGAMAGTLVYSEGKWKIYAGAYRGTTIPTLTDNDLRDSLKVQTLLSRRDLINGVKGVFRDPTNNWQPGDFPAVQNAAYIAQDNGFAPTQNQGQWAQGVGYLLGDCVFDNGSVWWCKLEHNSTLANEPSSAGGATYWTVSPERLWADLALQYTISPSAAQRLAKIQLERARRQIDLTFPGRLNALQPEVADVVQVSRTRFGWSNKPFEVYNTQFKVSQGPNNAPELGCDLGLRETDAAVYAWSPSSDETVVAFLGTQIVGDGSGSVIGKYQYDGGVAALGVAYQVSVVVKNQGAANITIGSNYNSSAAIPPGSIANITLNVTGDGATHLMLIFQTNAPGDVLNVLAISPFIGKVADQINLIPFPNQTFSGWGTLGGASTPAITQQRPTQPNVAFAAPPTNLVAATDIFTRKDGIQKTRIKATWTASPDKFVTSGGSMILEVSDHADGTPKVWRVAATVGGSETTAYAESVLDGHTYDVRVTAENASGARSIPLEADGLPISDNISQIGSNSFGAQGSIRPTAYPVWTVAQDTNNGSGACTVRLTAPATTLPLTDGTSVSFPASDFTWAGTLAAGTTYLFAPRQKIADGTVHFATGTGDNVDADPSTAPLTSAATAAQKNQLAINQNHDGYYPMSDGWIQVTTPNNAGTGGGSSGGDPACVHEDELAEAITDRGHGIYRLGDIEVDDLVKGRDLATGEARFRRVISRTREACYDWYEVQGRLMTPCEPVWCEEKFTWYPAHLTGLHRIGVAGYKITLTVEASCDDDHNFCLAEKDGSPEMVVHNGVVPRS